MQRELGVASVLGCLSTSIGFSESACDIKRRDFKIAAMGKFLSEAPPSLFADC